MTGTKANDSRKGRFLNSLPCIGWYISHKRLRQHRTLKISVRESVMQYFPASDFPMNKASLSPLSRSFHSWISSKQLYTGTEACLRARNNITVPILRNCVPHESWSESICNRLFSSVISARSRDASNDNFSPSTVTVFGFALDFADVFDFFPAMMSVCNSASCFRSKAIISSCFADSVFDVRVMPMWKRV